jgi:hypothetical protein
VAGDVKLTVVFALVSLVAVDITADDNMSELSDIHEGCLSRGGSNGGRTRSSSVGEMLRCEISGREGP